MSNSTYNPRSLGAIQPFVENNPVTIVSPRNPNTSDKAIIGQLWINNVTNGIFFLTSIQVGQFIWTNISGGADTFQTVTITGPGTNTLIVQTGNVQIQNGNLDITGVINAVGSTQQYIESTEAAATAIELHASNAAGGIALQAGTNGITLSAGGNIEVTPATATVASPADTATINKRVGVATFTGFTTAAAGSQVLSINNTFITATSGLLITATNLDVSTNGASVAITAVTQAVGSILFTVTNNGGGALGAGDNILVTFWVIS